MTKIATPLIRLVLLIGLVSPSANLVHRVSAESGGTVQSLEMTTLDGRTRSYRIFVPSGYVASTPTPLVLVFHGALGTSEQIAGLTEFDTKAETEGFIAVYPQSTSLPESDFLTAWNVGINFGDNQTDDVDDVVFIDQLLDSLETSYSTDPSRIFVTGFSNGGMFTNLLACQRADRFAAFAPVSGSISIADCQPGRAVPILAIHGKDDRIVNYDGGDLTGSSSHIPAAVDLIADWAAIDGCNSLPIISDVDKMTQTRFIECNQGATVALYSIGGLGHSWPGGEWFGSSGVNASELIWEFFDSIDPEPEQSLL